MSAIFNGCKFYFGRPPTISTKRLQLLKDLIVKHGGQLMDKKGEADYIISRQELPPDFISDCLESKSLLSPEEYKKKNNDQNEKKSSASTPKKQKSPISSTGIKAPKAKGIGEYYCFKPAPFHCPNDDLIGQLDVIRNHRYVHGNNRSELTYSRAITGLRVLPEKITPKFNVSQIDGIGPKIVHLIEEYWESGSIQEVEEIINDPQYVVLDSFCQIYGVGPKTALQLYNQGYRNVKDIPAVVLSPLQASGLKYYEDFRKLIPREESEKIIELIDKHMPKNCTLHPTGGYRRGKTASHDLDLVVQCSTAHLNNDNHRQLIKDLQHKGYILEVLAAGPQRIAPTPSELDTVLVAFKLPKSSNNTKDNGNNNKNNDNDIVCRRVDFIFCTPDQFPFTMLGWTGSRNYERNLRLYCKRELRLHLTSSGLYHAKASSSKKLRSVEDLHPRTEKDILDYLQVPFLKPEERHH